MSRWAEVPERAADALIARSLGDIGLGGRILLANPGGSLPAALAGRGLAVSTWKRRARGGGKAAPWPPAGPFDVALVRLAKVRDEQEMTAHAVLSALAPGGLMILYGGNDEGIRSAAAMLKTLCGTVETVAARGHGRVLAARRPQDTAGMRASLAAWRTVSPLEIAGRRRDWVTYPGIFAAGRLDEGTALLIGVLPPLAAGARVLDYGCGSGPIGAAALAAQPSLALDMLDSDAVALEAVRENVPSARRILGTGLADAGAGSSYAAILSNPPLHQGIAEDRALLEALVADAPARLAPGGVLQMVVQRRVPLDRLLGRNFADARVVAETGGYRVWNARRA